MRADLLRAAAGRPGAGHPGAARGGDGGAAPAAGGYAGAAGAPQTRQMPARVGDPRRRKASSWLIATFAAVGVLAVIALAAALLSQRDGEDLVTVPTVTGLTQAGGVRPDRAGQPGAQGRATRSSAHCQKGQVVNQDPPPTHPWRRTAMVDVRVCGGEPR